METLGRLYDEILEAKRKLKKQRRRLTALPSNIASITLLYGHFIEAVEGDPQKARRLLQRYFHL